MRERFNTCSYEELTQCVRGRIDRTREFRKFLDDPLTQKYMRVRFTIRMKLTLMKYEIRQLLKMRRVLKKSGFKNWDTDRMDAWKNENTNAQSDEK